MALAGRGSKIGTEVRRCHWLLTDFNRVLQMGGGLKRGPKPGTPEMQARRKARRTEKKKIADKARWAAKKGMKLKQALPDPGSAVARAGYGGVSQGVIDQKRASLEGGAKARGNIAEGLALCAMANSDIQPTDMTPKALMKTFEKAFASLALGLGGGDVVSAPASAPTTTPSDAANPCIALFGFSLQLMHSDDTYNEILEKAKKSQHVPGHFRDRARIIRMQEMGYDFCCVSLNSEDQDPEKHYEGNFCNAPRFIRGFKEFLGEIGMGEGNRPLQICVDWHWLPPGYDNDRIMQEGFFKNTLPLIALEGILSIEGDGGGGGDVPSGVVWVPHTLNIVKYIHKHKDLLEKYYAISYVGKELLLKEHAMYQATTSMSSEDMAILGKKKDDGKVSEWGNVSSAGWAKQKVSAADGIDADRFEEYVKEVHSESVLMVKLQLI